MAVNAEEEPAEELLPPLVAELEASQSLAAFRDAGRVRAFQEKYQRRVRQLTEEGFFTPKWKPYRDFAGPLDLAPRKVTLAGLIEQAPAPERPKEEEEPEKPAEPESPPKTPKVKEREKEEEKKPQSLRPPEKSLKTLHGELQHTKILINSVKMGRGYFYTLHKETVERKKALELEQKKEEERKRTELHPPKFSSSSSEEESPVKADPELLLAEGSFLRGTEKKKKKRPFLPFTPVHFGLMAERHPEGHFEPMFRQLCALHWLLEAMTMDISSSMKPLIACWDPKDYGGGKCSKKMLQKQKEVEAHWEQLLQGKPRKYGYKSSYRAPTSKKMTKKPSPANVIKSGKSSPHSKTTLASTSSSMPVSEEAVQPSSDSVRETEEIESSYSKHTKKMKEEPFSYSAVLVCNLKESYKKSLLKPPPPLLKDTLSMSRNLDIRSESSLKQKGKSSFIGREESLCEKIRELFNDVAQEAAYKLHDRLDVLERTREERSIKKYLVLRCTTTFQRDLLRMRQAVRITEPKPPPASSTHWFTTLMAKIPEDDKKDHRTQIVLKKLEVFAADPNLSIRPPTFLRVLGSLRTWELCSPDVCGALHFLREHIVKMPAKDYVQWLQVRVPVFKHPRRVRSAPLQTEHLQEGKDL